jgi:carboxylesterase type B
MLSMAANAEDAAGRPVVEVAHGRLLGSRIGRLYAFRGVPYAIADRFGPPQPDPPSRESEKPFTQGRYAPSSPLA